ncbi:DNA polymerase IV [Sedimenticola thiotaurini]|uniref:DNA polymerase IV n=1 Tax=Sedimenticola thiotaurini TaxID=1543721 RepID=A0A0F7JXS3_9GAMM|nr:DNA polymerase IV [Sedimenticola thiotaurini]AKH19468.1 DNA polymerase IV [Sedimenticola thiotaurini]
MTDKRIRWIMHVDMDAFYASVEQRDHPEYRGLPVVVGAQPGRRGVVSTCSYEARVFGIRSAMPISDAYRRCPDAVYLRPDMPRYVEVSRQVLEVLADISPVIEQVSVDEAYLDITGLERLYGPPRSIGERVKERVRERTGLNCSVGIGPNRLIAKLASDYDKPDGLTIVDVNEVERFLDPMPVSNLRGVGPRNLKTMARLGIKTVQQLRALPLDQLNSYFGDSMGESLYRQARGVSSDRVGEQSGRQSLSKETTFNEDITDQEQLRATLRGLAAEVGRSLRQAGLKGNVVTLKLRLSGFETHTRQRRLSSPGNADATLFRVAWELFQSSAFVRRPVRLIGLGVSDWSDGAHTNLDLFDAVEDDERQERLYSMLDKATERFGNGKLSLGAPLGKNRK